MPAVSAEEWLERFLNVYWLRPETALIFSHDAMMYQKLREVENNSMDIGCGDGITSFIFNGGIFSTKFDAYYSVNPDTSYVFEDKHPFLPGGVSDFYEGYDPGEFAALGNYVIQKPDMSYAYGTDWKQALVDKASYVGMYKKLVCHNSGKPLDFIKDESINYIFSNTVFWVPNHEDLIKEMHRMLAKGGVFVGSFPNKNLYDETAIDRYRVKYGLSWIGQLDRGRGAHWQEMQKSGQYWRRLFKKAGFRTVAHEYYFPKQHFEFTEIGLRPLFPTLAKMRKMILNQDDFVEFKRYWIKNCLHFVAPFFTDKFFQKQVKVFQMIRFEKK